MWALARSYWFDTLDDVSRPAASLSQRKALADMIPRCDMDAEQRASTVEAIATCKFVESDKVSLLTLSAGSRPKDQEKMSQGYKEFNGYAPRHLQTRLLDPEIQPNDFAFLLFNFLGKLGMRKADEYTYERMASFITVR